MDENCEKIKAVLEDLSTASISSTARLIAILEALGIEDREEVERLTNSKASTVREGRRALKIQRQKSITAENPAPEIQRSAGNPAQTMEIQRQKSSDPSRAHATKESSSKIVNNLEDITHTPSPQSVLHGEARVGEEHVGHGVFVNCETVRHERFTISLKAIELDLFGNANSDEIKRVATASAIQWAVEIENGKPAGLVVPGNIRGAVAATVRKHQGRQVAPDGGQVTALSRWKAKKAAQQMEVANG